MTVTLIHATKAEVDAIEAAMVRHECEMQGMPERKPDGFHRVLAELYAEAAAEARACDTLDDALGQGRN